MSPVRETQTSAGESALTILGAWMRLCPTRRKGTNAWLAIRAAVGLGVMLVVALLVLVHRVV